MGIAILLITLVFTVVCAVVLWLYVQPIYDPDDKSGMKGNSHD